MEQKEIDFKPYAKFLYEVGALAQTARTGFRHLGNWRQSVSEHLCRTAYIGFVLAHLEQERGETVNVGQVLENCLFHDLGEARATDLDYVSQKYSQTDELAAIKDAVKGLAFGDRIIRAFMEAEEKSTPESIITKDADNIELLCSLREIIDNGNKQAESWIAPIVKRLRTESAKKLATEVLTTSSDEWWYENKEDSYWVKGGKGHNDINNP